MDAFDWLAHAIGQLYLAQPLTEVDFRKLKVRHPFVMHVTPLNLTDQNVGKICVKIANLRVNV